jgi:hypothetical protein
MVSDEADSWELVSAVVVVLLAYAIIFTCFVFVPRL